MSGIRCDCRPAESNTVWRPYRDIFTGAPYTIQGSISISGNSNSQIGQLALDAVPRSPGIYVDIAFPLQFRGTCGYRFKLTDESVSPSRHSLTFLFGLDSRSVGKSWNVS